MGFREFRFQSPCKGLCCKRVHGLGLPGTGQVCWIQKGLAFCGDYIVVHCLAAVCVLTDALARQVWSKWMPTVLTRFSVHPLKFWNPSATTECLCFVVPTFISLSMVLGRVCLVLRARPQRTYLDPPTIPSNMPKLPTIKGHKA